MKLIHLSGTHAEIGYRLGKALKNEIQLVSEKRKNHYDPKLVPVVRKKFPQHLAELQGMAAGAGVPFKKLFAINSETFFLRCTTLAGKQKEKMFVAHNEDEGDFLLNATAMVHATLDTGVSFLSFVAAGELPGTSVSVNSYGLLQAVDAIPTQQIRHGIPNFFLCRAVLEARTLSEALLIFNAAKRTNNSHHLLMQSKGALSVEATPTAVSAQKIKIPFVHTNHFIHKRFRRYNLRSKSTSSLPRYLRARMLLSRMNALTPKSAQRILSDHHTPHFSICRHRIAGESTIACLRAFPEKKEIWVSKGAACKASFQKFKLK